MSVISLVRNPSQNYYLPLRPVITIQSADGEDTYFTYNAFHPELADIKINYLDVERAAFETGTFNMVIEDSSNTINKDHLENARVLLQFGKDENHLLPFSANFADIFETSEPRSNYQEHVLSGPSTKIQAAELMLLVRRATEDDKNPDYSIAQLVIDMVKKRKSRPLNRDDIEELTNWVAARVSEAGGISDQLDKVYYTVVNEVFTTLWDFIERMCALSGANWDLEYDEDFNEIITMNFPSSLHTGVLIKSIDQASSSDNPAKVSYLKSPFKQVIDSSSDAGVKTRVYTTTTIDRQVISSQMTNANFVLLTSQAIAQQVIIQNDQRRITDLAFILSKVGEPTSPKDRINGDIVMDFGDDTPRGITLATFTIPLGDIKSTARTIFVNDIDVKIRFLQGSNKIWLRLFQRSGTKGNPNTDTLNTIRVHHNGVSNIAQTLRSATAAGGDYSEKDTLVWVPSTMGPIFCYSVFSKINRLYARSNPSAAAYLRWKEAFFDSQYLGSNFVEINKLASLYLDKVSKSRLSVGGFKCTVPNGFLFKPYQYVTLTHGLSGTAEELQVQRARITCSASEDVPVGAMDMELSLSGPRNRVVGSCSCA